MAGEFGASWSDPTLLAIGAGLLFAWYVTLAHHLQVMSGFASLREAVERFSAGDLEYRDDGASTGEIGMLLEKIEDMSARLAEVFGRVRARRRPKRSRR